MDEYREFITTLVVSTLIPSFYMLAYVLKGKEKGILAFFKTLAYCLPMYFSSLIPIMLMVLMFSRVDHNDLMSVCAIDVCAIVFSTPFLSELIKRISIDFEVPHGFESHFKFLILFIAMVVLFGSLSIVFIAGFIAGEVSIFAVIAILYMLVGVISIMIISRLKIKYAEDFEKLEKIKKNEQKLGIVLAIFMFIFFGLVMIF